jgi:hypothetical protein
MFSLDTVTVTNNTTGEFLVSPPESIHQGSPRVAMNSAGDLVITWARRKQDASEYDAYSVLISTASRTQSGDVLFTKYKQPCYFELANHELKTPLAVHPVFLKSPHRVEALVFLLMLALTLYFLIQRLYRQNLPQDAPTKERRITAQTILRAFNSYALILHRTRLGREVRPTRLTTRQREILAQLGFSTPAQILSRQLPRVP